MRVTIVTAYVVHPSPILLVGKLNRLVPLFPLGRIITTRNKRRYVQTEGPRRFAKRHPPPITDAVGPLKVGSDTFGVSDPHVTNKWQNISDGRKGDQRIQKLRSFGLWAAAEGVVVVLPTPPPLEADPTPM